MANDEETWETIQPVLSVSSVSKLPELGRR